MQHSHILHPSRVKRLFSQNFRQIWQSIRERRIGLAISGGVDSMALASLCHLVQQGRPPDLFTAFVVDHGLRDGSAEEAVQVLQRLQKLKIKCRILQPSWDPFAQTEPKSLTNLESTARKLRYAALGKACREDDLQALFVAHHADDQAETVLVRMFGGYLGAGLQGIRPVNNIPECFGLYGVNRSGSPRTGRVGTNAESFGSGDILIESGGVDIYRPLLGFFKNELIGVCRQDNVSWVEDETNSDQKYTLRNAIRHVQQSDELPKALQTSSLCSISRSREASTNELTKAANVLFNKIPMQLDLKTASAVFTVPIGAKLHEEPRNDYHIKALVLRRLLSLVSPLDDIGLQELDRAMDFVFGGPDILIDFPGGRPLKLDVCGVSIREEPSDLADGVQPGRLKRVITLQRHLPPERVQRQQTIGLALKNSHEAYAASDWLLWDGRYWIRVGRSLHAHHSHHTVSVQFLSPDTLGLLRPDLKRKSRGMLDHILKTIRVDARWTLPVITVTDTKTEQSQIVALPTLSFSHRHWVRLPNGADPSSSSNWWYEIRYKHIDYQWTPKHRISAAPSL